MLQTVKGIYENGKIRLLSKKLPHGKKEVLVTFLSKEKTTDEKEKKVKEFLEKWSGVLKTEEVNDMKDERIEYLLRKHK